MSQIEKSKIIRLNKILVKKEVACFDKNENVIRYGISIIPGYFSFCEAARTQLGLPPVEGLTIYNPPFPNKSLLISSVCHECPALASALIQLEQVIASHTINDFIPCDPLSYATK